MDLPWIEKYRPTNIDDLIMNDIDYKRIKQIISDRNMPNIIITGIPGIGKTTTVKCIARELLGDYIKDALIELNASDERGIKSINETNLFCKKMINNKNGDAPFHKIILLDEADNMTSKAQKIVNSLMDTHYKTTRFAFTCNNSSAIIESIQSRCKIIQYERLNYDKITDKLSKICDNEDIKYDIDTLDLISHLSNGDMRKAINDLQLICNCFNYVSQETFNSTYTKPSLDIIENIICYCYKKDIKNAINELEKLINDGYTSTDIIDNFQYLLKNESFNKIPEKYKVFYFKYTSDACYIVNKCIDEKIQLFGCIADMVNIV